jgi:SAM-dependent methyltransferase
VSAIVDLFAGLERAAPGDAGALRRALAVAGTPPGGRVLDAGCGPGADLPVLVAAVPQGQVVALDLAPPFIARVRARWPAVRAEVADMTDPPGGPFDLIWSGGAIYNLGVTPALAAWRRHLAPGGCVAFTDLRWTGSERPDEAAAFWASEGVAVSDAAALEAEVAAAGYACLEAFWLDRAAWAAYYEPVERRLDALAGATGEMAATVEAFRREIALWRRHGVHYGYRLVVCRPGPGA